MNIRATRLEDNQGLIDLSNQCTLLGNLSVTMDRGPDFFRHYQQYGNCLNDVPPELIDPKGDPGWVSACAMQGDTLIGLLTICLRLVNYEGSVLRLGTVMDALVLPEFRRGGLSKKLAEYAMEKWGKAETDLLIGYVTMGNDPTIKNYAESLQNLVSGRHIGNFHLVQLTLYRPYRTKKIHIERATKDDIPEILDLLLEFYADYHFSPLFTKDNWADMLSRTPGYSMDDIRLYRKEGKIQAMVGLWDHEIVRRVVATDFPKAVKVGISIAKVLNLLMQSPRPPKIGQVQKSLFIKHIAHRPGHLSTLTQLMKTVTNQVRMDGNHHYIWGSFHDKDPIFTIFDHFLATDFRSIQYYVPWNSGWNKSPFEIENKPCYADFSMI